jgi:hypothetical protein
VDALALHAGHFAHYAVAGRKRPAPPEDIQKLDAADPLQLLEGIPVRPDTKLAALAAALRRPQGTTNLQLMLDALLVRDVDSEA